MTGLNFAIDPVKNRPALAHWARLLARLFRSRYLLLCWPVSMETTPRQQGHKWSPGGWAGLKCNTRRDKECLQGERKWGREIKLCVKGGQGWKWIPVLSTCSTHPHKKLHNWPRADWREYSTWPVWLNIRPNWKVAIKWPISVWAGRNDNCPR